MCVIVLYNIMYVCLSVANKGHLLSYLENATVLKQKAGAHTTEYNETVM